jgi:predicted ABC-type ATPase
MDGKGINAYYGVPFNTDYVMKTALKTKVWGIMSHTNPSLFKESDPKKFLKDAFDPNQPRDKDGQWTKGADHLSGEFSHHPDFIYHGTSSKHAADIQKNGFKPGTFFSTDPYTAQQEAEYAVKGDPFASQEQINSGHPNAHGVGGDEVVFAIKKSDLAKHHFKDDNDYPSDQDYGKAVIVKQKIDPSAIGEVLKTDKQFKTHQKKLINSSMNPKLNTIKDFDPNQPRDKDGKWSETGAGGDHSNSTTPSQDLLALHHDDEHDTFDNVLAQLTPEQKAAMARAEDSMKDLKPTNVEFVGPDGKYTPERAALQAEILNDKIFTKDRIAAAVPKNGEKPVLTLTGGRPAAGKTSALRNELGDTAKNSFYISADEIQEHLPGYTGEHAGIYNGEAQDMALQAEKIAREHGLNITYDATLKSTQPAHDRVDMYKAAGYDVNGYFVHTSPTTSAVRSAQRFMTTGRYVPPIVSFKSRTNEKTFDSLIPKLKKWAVYDNNGAKPKRIAGSKS